MSETTAGGTLTLRDSRTGAACNAAILYDKFHVLSQLNDAMDQVRKAEYKRLTNRADRIQIKGQKYVLLSHRANLSPTKRQSLRRCWLRTSVSTPPTS